MKKEYFFWLIVLTIPLGALELCAFFSILFLKEERTYYFREDFIALHFRSMNDDDFARFKQLAYDPLLGWDNKPNSIKHKLNVAGQNTLASYDRDGARHDGLADKPVLGAAYGDSHTHCDEVNNSETWQAYLGHELGLRIKNYGVGGYGTDQALLKFESHVARGDINAISILGIYEENINRILSQFRPFYAPSTTEDLAFKPRFELHGSRLTLVPNPLPPDVTTIAAAEGAARKLISTDYWARPALEDRFPYFLQTPVILEIIWSRMQRMLGPVFPAWADESTSELMAEIVSRFIRNAEVADTQPVLLFLPAVGTWRDGRLEPSYERFKRQLRRRYQNVMIIDISEHDFDLPRFNVMPFAGHVSDYGNRLIANIIAQELKKGIATWRLDSSALTKSGLADSLLSAVAARGEHGPRVGQPRRMVSIEPS